jgi:phenylpropionate dioxygenase-like ring-hydroxylating dioxygenase large terminal subunit
VFQDFANVWTAVEQSSKLSTKPISVEVAGEKVVLFRSKGSVHALIDRCPHRGVPLSLGTVTPEGCLECPFHGWQFQGDGSCAHVPLNPDAKRDLLSATALPAREIGGLLWVYTAPGAAASSEPVLPEGVTRGDLARTILIEDWNTHWTRAMENMLDSPHLPFVHRKTIGRAMRAKLTPTSKMNVTWEDTPFGGRTKSSLDQEESPAFLEYYRPNIMALHIPIPGKHFRIHAMCVPTGTNKTRMIIVGSRDFLKLPLLNAVFGRSNGRIVREDRAVVESSPEGPVPPAGVERSVETDRATLKFRQYYHQTLRGSHAESNG